MAMKTRWPTAVWLIKRKIKRGVSYTVRWRDRSGRQYAQSCGPDRQLALELLKNKRQQLWNGATGKLPDVTIGQFVDRLESLMAGKSPNTIGKTQESLRVLARECGDRLLVDVDRAMVLDFRAKRLAAELSPATVNKDLRQIKSALSYAVDAGLLHGNPLLRWKGMTVREAERTIRVIEPAEFAALLNATEYTEFRALLTVAYRQGLRRSELCNLRWLGPHGEKLVDFDGGVLHVINRWQEGELTKSRKNRGIPLHPQAREALAGLWKAAPKLVADGAVQPKYPHVFMHPDGRRFVPDWVSHEFARLVKRAKIADATLHDLRRSFSTLAQRAGVDKYTVKDLGGWSAVSVVEKHYSGDVSPALKAAMDRIVAAG